MLVAIHQPNFLPWLGYFDRMVNADLFVLLDHVQFERRNYQNRAQIRLEDEARWLTVPVVQLSQKERIVEKRVDNPEGDGPRWWGPNSFQTLRYAYRKAPHFELYAPRLREILETRWEKLVDLNIATLEFVRDALEIRTPMVRSSTLTVRGPALGAAARHLPASGRLGLPGRNGRLAHVSRQRGVRRREHGRRVAGIPPSTVSAVRHGAVHQGPLGAGRALQLRPGGPRARVAAEGGAR